MADSDKKILITPATGTTSQPTIQFVGGSNNPVDLNVLDDGTLSFTGSSGQLFSISDSLSGTIFSVNDVSGIPSIEVEDDGTVKFAEFAGNVLVGTNLDDGQNKLQVQGSINVSQTVSSYEANTVYFKLNGTTIAANNMATVGSVLTLTNTGYIDLAPASGGDSLLTLRNATMVPGESNYAIFTGSMLDLVNESADKFNSYILAFTQPSISIYFRNTASWYSSYGFDYADYGVQKVYYFYVINEYGSATLTWDHENGPGWVKFEGTSPPAAPDQNKFSLYAAIVTKDGNTNSQYNMPQVMVKTLIDNMPWTTTT